MTVEVGPKSRVPLDANGTLARAYEECVVSLLRTAVEKSNADAEALFRPGRVEISLRGERPETEIIFRLLDFGESYVFALWRSEYATCGAIGALQEPYSVAGWIWSDWEAGDLDPLPG